MFSTDEKINFSKVGLAKFLINDILENRAKSGEMCSMRGIGY